MTDRANQLRAYMDMYNQTGMGGMGYNFTPTEWSGFSLTKQGTPALSPGQQAANAMRWAEEQVSKQGRSDFFNNMFGGYGNNRQGPMPQFNTPMPANPYSQRVDQFQRPDPVQGQVKNYLSQMFSQQPSTPIGYRNV